MPVLRRVGAAPGRFGGMHPGILARLDTWFFEDGPEGAARARFPWAPLAGAVGAGAILGLAAFGLAVLLGIGRPSAARTKTGLVPTAPPAATVPAVSHPSATAPQPSPFDPVAPPQVPARPPASSTRPAQGPSPASTETPPPKASATPPLSVPGQVLPPPNAGGATVCKIRKEHGQDFLYGCHWVVNQTPGA